MMIVPLDVGGKRQGVLTANSSRPGSFNEGDLAFLQIVAQWVGMVAQRAELTEAVACEAAERARRATAEELMQVLAHDLTNLVTPALGRLDLIRRQAEREGNRTYLDHAEAASASVRRIGRLARDLLNAARLEHGLFALACQPVDLLSLSREAAALVETEDTAVEVRGIGEIMVEGDQDRLRQVLENVLPNAVRHSPAGLPVVVEVGQQTRADGQWAVVRVVDQGPGIAPQLIPMLFQRFSPGPDSSGLGLGLYLARGIAEAHGGTLDVDPTTSRGTTMILTLPSSAS
jgi:signal transduction histidine kinase